MRPLLHCPTVEMKGRDALSREVSEFVDKLWHHDLGMIVDPANTQPLCSCRTARHNTCLPSSGHRRSFFLPHTPYNLAVGESECAG